MPYYDTAGSVAFVAREKNPEYAAIAGSENAGIYGLEVFKEGIETNPRNYTRFAVITRAEHSSPEVWNKASLVFAVSDTPGSLFQCLKILSEQNLNMKKLESRPILGKPWQYMFYVDVEIPDNRSCFDNAIEGLKSCAQDLRILGIYKAE